jgi:hypothetical protein
VLPIFAEGTVLAVLSHAIIWEWMNSKAMSNAGMQSTAINTNGCYSLYQLTVAKV